MSFTGVITVSLVEAKDLPIGSKEGIKCVAQVGLIGGGKAPAQRQKTKPQRNTLTPYWNETFEVYLIDQNDERENFKISVLDYDEVFGSEKLGEYLFESKDFSENKLIRKWLNLENPKGGQIFIEIAYRKLTKTESSQINVQTGKKVVAEADLLGEEDEPDDKSKKSDKKKESIFHIKSKKEKVEEEKKRKDQEFEEELQRVREQEEKQILAEYERKRVSERELMVKEEMEFQRLQFEARAIFEAEQQRMQDDEERAAKMTLAKQKRDEAEKKRKDDEDKFRQKVESKSKNLCGFLSKKGHMRTNWNVRYFKMVGKEMVYYVDNSCEKEKGRLSLENCNVDRVERDGRKFCLLVKPTAYKKDYLLSAARQDELDDWYRAIKFAATGLLEL